jgi:hypothetical protein
MLGYGLPAKSYGVYGVTFGTNGIGVYGAGDGPTPAPSATPSSTQQSTGVVGNSASGDGVYGSTEFPNGNAGSLTNPAAGVLGVDNQTTNITDNMGVAGETTNGDFGVAGLGGDNALGGVIGSGDSGVYGLSFDDGSAFPNAAGGWFYGQYAIYGESATASGSSTTSYPLYLEDSNQSPLFYVDNSGNFAATGTESTLSRTRNAAVRAKSYVPSESQPTSEDFGEAALVNGQAYVHLDPTFAQSIDDRSAYMVFVTPEGDTNGVYVTQKSMSGFAVRENKGGRSSVSFSYRIVAAQYGKATQRMTLVDSTTLGVRAAASSSVYSRDPRRSIRVARMLQSVHAHHALQTFRPTPNAAAERMP